MAHKPEKRQEARKRYVFERQSLPTIAEALGMPQSTISRWKREAKALGDDWHARRAAHLVAGEGLDSVVAAVAEDFVMLAQETVAAIRNDEDMKAEKRAQLLASLADAMGKVVSSAGRLAPKISELGVAQDVLARLGTYVGQHHPDQATTFLELLEPFAAEIAEVYG